MPTHVRFRFNARTGAVEEFLVDTQNRQLPEAEHDRRALDIARRLARRPEISEILPRVIRSRPEPERSEPVLTEVEANSQDEKLLNDG